MNKYPEVERWITSKGARIPIFKGETVEDAFKRHFKKSPKKIETEKIVEPEFKSFQEAYDFYEKKFSECSSTYRNKVAGKLDIKVRGQEKIKALANAYADKWAKTHQINQDADLKDIQIANNAKQAAQASAPSKFDNSYSRFDDPWDMTHQFMQDTNIVVDAAVYSLIPKEKLAVIYDTIKDIRDKYNPNIFQITIEPEGSIHMGEDVAADMNNFGRLRLNAKYFSHPDVMRIIQENNNNSYIFYHPQTQDDGYVRTVSHELGHAILYRQINRWFYDHSDPALANQYYDELCDYLSCKWPKITPGNELFNKFDTAIRKIQDRLNKDPEIIKRWGREPNLGILGFANPQFCWKGLAISEYAGKNFHELIAEAFCEVYCNGYKNSSRVAREVWDEIITGAWLE